MRAQTERRRDAFAGCLLGGAIGDALGAPVEFLSLTQILARFGPSGVSEFVPAYGRAGAVTDDTQMTLFTAEGLLRSTSRFLEKGICHPPTVIYHGYLRWLDTQGVVPAYPFADVRSGRLVDVPEMRHRRAPGNTCLAALESGKMGTMAEPLNNSKGCGGVMRVAPVGLVADDPFELACDAAAITHGHPTGFLTAGVFAMLVSRAWQGIPLDEALDEAVGVLRTKNGHEETLEAMHRARAVASGGPRSAESVELLGQGWVAEESLAIAIFCALNAESFAEGVLLAANHSGDSDSTASMTGNLLGAA